VEIRPFIGAEASEDELRQCYELFISDVRRTFPGFPEQPYESFMAAMRDPRSGSVGPRQVWAAYEGDQVLGFATVVYPDRRLLDWANPRVFVSESHRRRGIGTALLRELVADAGARGRTTLACELVRIGTEGDHWARAVGFTDTQRTCWQMLYVADVDPALWEIPVPEGFRLVQWADAAPDELVAAFAAARNAIADAPRGDSSYQNEEWTVARVRQVEADLREAGDDSRFVVAVHEETGAVAALTGMRLDPRRVDLCWQRDTAVVAQYRGLGLGRVVKAAMMRWLLTDIPDLGRVTTSTAADNAYMIRVNEQIGYTHYSEMGLFEAPVERIGAALGMQGTNSIPGPRREPEQELEGA